MKTREVTIDVPCNLDRAVCAAMRRDLPRKDRAEYSRKIWSAAATAGIRPFMEDEEWIAQHPRKRGAR